MKAQPEGFDPRLSAERQRDLPIQRMGKSSVKQPETYFMGTWDQRNVLNMPGPFYGAETDTCMDGPEYAPASLLCDAIGQGFVWRQPRNDVETLALMTGASSDPFGGFGWDGDQHWTPDLVRDWWARRDERAHMVSSLVTELTNPRLAASSLWISLVASYGDYIVFGLEEGLGRYLSFLETGRYPREGETLPAL